MNYFLNGVARATAETFELPGPVLEVGSYQVAGQGDLINLRGLFPDKPYRGIDIRPGPGVDELADVEALPYPDASFGTVIAFNTFEHVRRFWRGFAEVFRVLRSDGAFVFSCPFSMHLHDYPHDYWRFAPAALEVLLEEYSSTVIGWHGAHRRPASVWAVAFREEAPPVTPALLARYRNLIAQYSHEPRSWTRTVRYQLGRLVCGRRPFAPYLDLNRWDCVCRTSSLPHASSRSAPEAVRPLDRVRARH